MTLSDDREDTLSETEHFEVWVSVEEDGERIYHLDTGRVTVHLFPEEWQELVALIESAARK
jgi:hypothetical protein